jgi:hypothetical protein
MNERSWHYDSHVRQTGVIDLLLQLNPEKN